MLSVEPPPTRRRGRPPTSRRQQALEERLAEVRARQAALRAETAAFLEAPAAVDTASAALAAMAELRRVGPEATVLCAQTGAVVERIANANEVAEKMTREVRRLDIVQSRLTATLGHAQQQLRLRHALGGLRRAMHRREYVEAAACLRELKAIEEVLPLDVADKLRVETLEGDLQQVIDQNWDEGLARGDRARLHEFAPLFQVVGRAYEAQGYARLHEHLTGALGTALAPLTHGAFSTHELLGHLPTAFNHVAAVAQEHDELVRGAFARVDGPRRLVRAIYDLGEGAAVKILSAYMQQRQFRPRMTRASVGGGEQREGPSGSASSSSTAAAAAAVSGSSLAASSTAAADEEIASLNEQLNEMALMIQHTQTFERFMRSRVTKDDDDDVLPPSHESELGKTVQELAGYYCFFENEHLTKAARKAFQWEEVRWASAPGSADAVFPISSAIDEIMYVAQNSGLRGLATGHADCAAGVLNMITTVLRDVVGDTMRGRIRNMAAHVRLEADSASLVAQASTQLRDQMQQQFAKLSKTMGPLPITGGGGSSGATGEAGAAEGRRELGPEVVMNSLAATTAYIAQLRVELERELREDFEAVPSHLVTALNALEDASGDLTQLLGAARKKLVKLLEPRLTSLLGPLVAAPTAKRPAVSYELTEHTYTCNEANDPFALHFAAGVRELLAGFRAGLSPANFAELVDLVAGATVDAIERWFYGRHVRFNQLGALQFDKDVRVLGSCFHEHHPESRGRFATLTQIAMVLNVDAPSDVAEFFGRRSRGVDWRLSAAQVKEVLARRVEFGDAAINKLSLPRAPPQA